MQLRPEDLPAHLAKGLAPLYVIHGDEPLLALEAGDAIRDAARRAGIEEREVLVAERDFKWDGFVGAQANMGLFGTQRLVDLRIPSGKPGVEGAKALEAYASNPNPDTITMITLPRLDRAAQGSAWFSALADAGASIAVQPVDRAALPQWIAGRLARQKQKASRETLAFLADRCEGNLLAARQEIEKLALLLPEGELSHEEVEAATADVARYDVFGLSEAWLAGEPARVMRILDTLQAEGESVTLVVWQLSEDVHAIAGVMTMVAQGTPASIAVRNARVWGKRQAALERAVRRMARADLTPLLASLARLDALSKGLGAGNPWEEVAVAALALAGAPARPLVAPPTRVA